jgi:hypothetical protein
MEVAWGDMVVVYCLATRWRGRLTHVYGMIHGWDKWKLAEKAWVAQLVRPS